MSTKESWEDRFAFVDSVDRELVIEKVRRLLAHRTESLKEAVEGMKMSGHHKRRKAGCAACSYQYGVNQSVLQFLTLLDSQKD